MIVPIFVILEGHREDCDPSLMFSVSESVNRLSISFPLLTTLSLSLPITNFIMKADRDLSYEMGMLWGVPPIVVLNSSHFPSFLFGDRSRIEKL